jgi:glycosyltransferase involved in cell wall biosynthesis
MPAYVSVVITSNNEGEFLARTVESLLRHLPPGGEIVVIDDASTDGSVTRLPGAGRQVKVHRFEKRLGACVGLNFGAQHSRGEILVFSDAFCELKDL